MRKKLLFFNSISKSIKTKTDAICLKETRLSDCNVNRCSLVGYRLFYCNSKTKAGGSVIYVSDDIDCQQFDNVKIIVNGCENVWEYKIIRGCSRRYTLVVIDIIITQCNVI